MQTLRGEYFIIAKLRINEYEKQIYSLNKAIQKLFGEKTLKYYGTLKKIKIKIKDKNLLNKQAFLI